MAELSEPVADTQSAAISDALDSTEAGGRILRGGAVRFVVYVLVVLLSVLSAALLTRHLGVGRFGQYTTVLSLVAVLSSITDAGMSSVGAREFAVREGAERDALMRDLLGLRIVLTSVGVLLTLAVAAAAGYDHALLLGALLASLGTIALVIQHTHTIPISAGLRIGTLSALELARQVLSVAAIVLLVVLGAGVLPLLAVALAVNLVLIPPTARLARHQISLKLSFHPRRWRALIALTISFSLATAVGTIYVYTAQILTSFVASQHQSGLFAASFRVFIAVSAVPGLLVGGALPLLARAARDDRERLSYALGRIFDVSLIIGVGIAVGLLGGAQFTIQVIAGPKYAGAAGVLQIQGLAVIASFVLAGWSFALLSLERYKGLLLANLGALILSTGLTPLLAGSDGAEGAAIASLCSEAALAAGLLFTLVRGHPEFRPPAGIVAKVLFAAAPAVVIALLSGLPSLAAALLALAAYAVLIALTRAIPAEVRDLIPLRLRRPG